MRPRLPILRLGRLEIGPEPAALKDRRRQTFGERPEGTLPREQALDRAALEARSARQADGWIEVRRRFLEGFDVLFNQRD